MVHACQARLVSDIEIETERVPDQISIFARVAAITRLSPDVFGVDIELPKPFHYLPGQFCKLQFLGFPARNYSPTYPLEGRPNKHLMHFHIRRFPDGVVSSELGQDHPCRAPRQGDRAVRQRLSQTQSCREHCACVQRHRLCSNVVCGSRIDHGTPGAGADFRGSGTKAPVALYACRIVPPGAVSQRHDHSDRVGAAERFARYPCRTSNRSLPILSPNDSFTFPVLPP